MITGKRIYMAGAGGMLGEAFYKIYNINNTVRCTDKDINVEWLNFLDFRESNVGNKIVRYPKY